MDHLSGYDFSAARLSGMERSWDRALSAISLSCRAADIIPNLQCCQVRDRNSSSNISNQGKAYNEPGRIVEDLSRPRHIRLTLIVMLGRLHSLGTGQSTSKGLWVVDEHGKMLRTNPELLVLVFERNQGYLRSCSIARNAMRFLRMIAGHGSLSRIRCCMKSCFLFCDPMRERCTPSLPRKHRHHLRIDRKIIHAAFEGFVVPLVQ